MLTESFNNNTPIVIPDRCECKWCKWFMDPSALGKCHHNEVKERCELCNEHCDVHFHAQFYVPLCALGTQLCSAVMTSTIIIYTNRSLHRMTKSFLHRIVKLLHRISLLLTSLPLSLVLPLSSTPPLWPRHLWWH